MTKETPPTFLFSTTDDKTVPVMNSVMFYSGLVSAGVPGGDAHLPAWRSWGWAGVYESAVEGLVGAFADQMDAGAGVYGDSGTVGR